jgi:RNA polymerase sigma-70 factor (ECF subfamily)
MDLRDPATFSRVYADHAAEVESIARRVLGDGAHAQDVAHDVFLRLWTNPAAYDASRGPVGAYLRLLARSRAIDAQRSRRAAERAGDRFRATVEDARPVAEAGPASAEAREVRRELGRALRTLPDCQRQAVLLAYWGDLPDHQVARRAGVPVGTAKSRIRLGLRRLRASYQPV